MSKSREKRWSKVRGRKNIYAGDRIQGFLTKDVLIYLLKPGSQYVCDPISSCQEDQIGLKS